MKELKDNILLLVDECKDMSVLKLIFGILARLV